jgi:two-component sensor histidine kinase
MVIAELISNSYSHAFAGRDGGAIAVSLRKTDPQGGMTLVVADDGVGFAETPGSNRHGVGLVRRLVQQVGGQSRARVRRGGRDVDDPCAGVRRRGRLSEVDAP